MSIAALQQLTLLGDADQKGEIMDAVQALGVVHLVPLARLPMEVGPDAADDFREALRYLLNAPRKRRRQRPPMEMELQAVVLPRLGQTVDGDSNAALALLAALASFGLSMVGSSNLPPMDSPSPSPVTTHTSNSGLANFTPVAKAGARL